MNKTKEKRVAVPNRVAAGKRASWPLSPPCKKGFEGFVGFVTKIEIQSNNNQIIRPMKKLVSILILCLACLGGLEAQNYWKPIGMQGIFLGVSPDGSIYSYYGGSGNGPCFTRSQDEGETWQVVLGYETGFNCNFNSKCFSISPEGRIFLFEGYPYRAFYSDDNGDTWQLTSGAAPLIDGDEAQQICAVNNETLVGMTGYYFFWTTDGGASWDTIRPAFIADDQYIGDILANGNGDVYFCLNLNNGAPSGNSAIGVYHATLSDMDHWELVAFEGVSINDMEFDPEGNVVCNALVGDNFDGFEHVPGFYAFGSYNTFGISDNGIVYKSIETENNTAVLAYSMDHGETFTEIGEELELYPPVPGSSDGFLCKGYDNFLYFKCRGLYWKSIRSANYIPPKFAPLGAEWYFHVLSQGPITEPPFYYIQYMVTGEEVVQGHTCSVINGYELVYEEDGVVYWYNPSDDAFTVLYDFNAEAGESWYCAVADYYPCLITVDSVGSVTWDGHTYRTQYVTGVIEDYWTVMDGRIIEGIGYEKGLFPEVVIDGPEYEYMRCYLVDGEMLYHEGDYDCDYVPQTGSPCWDGSVADAYEGGDGTEGNPYQIATPQQLALLAQQTNTGTGGDAHYILTDDICLNVENDSIDWPVIGKETSQNLPIYFTGVFDGNGHNIERMIIRENHVDAGLFGHTRGAVIKNLRVTDASIQVGSDVGIIVGQAYNTSIINCTVQNCSISHEHNSNNYVGGIVGGYYPTDNASDTVYIKDCVSEVRFLNPERFFIAGGIVGRCMTMSVDGGYAVIENCENRSDVRGSHHVGGIMGDADNSHNGESLALIIKGCRNYGTISSTTFCGGIVAHSWGVQMIDCLNMGEVVARDVNSDVLVGGLATLLKESVMVECVNKGNVISESNFGTQIGGLVGYNDESVIANSYNLGTVAAPNSTPANSTVAIGGIVGGSTGRIFNVYNAGALTVPETPSGAEAEGYGHILGAGDVAEHYLNCYWLEQDSLPACGNMELPGSSSFHPTSYFFEWELNEPQYGHYDLLEVLNFGAEVVLDSVPSYPYLATWSADLANINQGFPILYSEPELPDTIQSGDLLYSIISMNPPYMRVIGHVDGENAQGEIVIPETVEYEGDTYVVTEVGERAFNYCRSIVSIDVANTVTRIGSRAFYDCDNLQSIHLPDSLEAVSSEMFFGCSSLTEVSLPSTITEIGEGAFSSCRALNEIVLPESVSVIRNEAFSSCVQLHSITFPETMISIGRMAFFNCGNLTEALLPLGLTTLSELLFSQCGKLESVVIPESVTSIDKYAFSNCESLNEIVIPNGVESIGRSAFEGCSSLSLVELGSSVSYLAEAVFLIHSLEVRLNFVCHNPVPAQCEHNTFPQDVEQQGVIMVPCETGEAYREAWGEYWQNGTIEEDCGEGLIEFHGSEWYYEILGDNGNVTYQHLEYVADTTVNHKDVQIIIRTNTLYDKGEHQDVTREYLYTEDEVVYWWNKELQEFTVLYDLGAQQGDSWVIKVGTETLTMHVDAVGYNYYGEQLFKMLYVSDDQDLFSGTIVSGVGHLSSFFPERLMTRGKGYGVNGLRCYWRFGNLLFTVNRGDCDAIYAELHNGLDEPTAIPFTIYPNPTNGVLTIQHSALTTSNASHFNIPNSSFRITNLMGQTVQTGNLTAETQQIDVSDLPQGMYFISLGDMTRKFVVR